MQGHNATERLKSIAFSAVVLHMSSEFVIEEPTPSPPPANQRPPRNWNWKGKWKWILAGAIAVVAVCVVWLCLRLIPDRKTPGLRGLKLVEAAVPVPAASFKSVDLLLPCAGTLSLDLTAPKGSDVYVFVVAPAELAKMQARKTFAHLDGFDGNQITVYHRTRNLAPGRYSLVLMNRSAQPPATPVRVNARLEKLQ